MRQAKQTENHFCLEDFLGIRKRLMGNKIITVERVGYG